MPRPGKKTDERLSKLQRQLTAAQEAVAANREEVASLEQQTARRAALADHLRGFYDEIDKLTKGKAFMEATPLVVVNVNEVIKDAKGLIKGDPFLDRVKEFVPAGENPVHSDVLLITRSVQQSIGRHEGVLREALQRSKRNLRYVRTVEVGLELCLDDLDTLPLKADVSAVLGEEMSSRCFTLDQDDEEVFNPDSLEQDRADA